MRFTEKEKLLAKSLRDTGWAWNPEEGDYFWATEDFSHQFYLGESLPSSFFFRKAEVYIFDSAMTWHIQQGGLKLDKLIWLPTWAQCRTRLKEKRIPLHLEDQGEEVYIETRNSAKSFAASSATDLEALYSLLLQINNQGHIP